MGDSSEVEKTQAQQREETRARLAKAATALKAQRDIATGLLTEDLSLAERVQALGFTEETAKVFDLLPVLHVAWADGEVQRPEREAIARVLEIRGVDEGSAGHLLITALIEKHPGQAYMEETIAIIRELVTTNNRRAEALVDLCYVIAEAHGGGLFGFRDPIDASERRALNEVAEALGERAEMWLKAKFGEL